MEIHCGVEMIFNTAAFSDSGRGLVLESPISSGPLTGILRKPARF